MRALAEYAVDRANKTHAAGHAAGFPAIHDSPQRLIDALHQVEKELGRPRPTIVATPKWSMFTPFYRASGVSGQLGPFFLETLLNPDLTGPERPAVLAHEWAHLSGYAPESDASFVGLLAALRAGPAAEYSAWLDLVSESVNQLQPVTQRIVLQKLAQGPRDDQEAIRERLKALVRPVERVAWSSYDRMLKSQGVEEGVQSYSRVIQLLIGTDALKHQALKTSSPQDLKPMKTRVIQVDRERPDPAAIEEAAAALRDGKLVVFPTETVYGLGAHALDPIAVQKIFDAKERPANDPLIVHIAHIGQVNQCAAGMPAGARKLALSFWAGPLTLILKKKPEVPDLVTAGLPSVALRVPSHRVARALMEMAGIPIAAPSANRFSRPSPTTAAHVHRGSRRPRRPDPRCGPHGHRPRIHDRRLLGRSAGAAPARAASPSNRCSRSCPR